MLDLRRITVLAATAACVPAQFFVDHARSMYGEAVNATNTVVIDVDGDGHPDLLARSGTETRCYRNDGAGNFKFLAASPFSSGEAWPQGVGDYNGDGLADYCSGGALVRNLGNGSFAIDTSFSVSTLGPAPSAFIDHDDDGDLDWLVAAGATRLFANNGTGVFTEVTSTVLAGFDLGVQDFRVVDLDADGDDDLVKTSGGLGPLTVKVWRNLGNGQLAEEALPAPVSIGGFCFLDVADFDGDGRPDAAVTAPNIASSGTTITTWLIVRATGAWTMQALNVPVTVGNELATADAGDWDGDGRADWVVRAGVYRQTGALQFAFQAFPAGTALTTQPMLVDLDQDQRLDVVALGGRGYLRNRPAGVMPSERPFVVGGSAVQTCHVRRRAAGSPDVGVLAHNGGGARWGTDEALPGDVDRTLRMVGQISATGVAFVAPPTAGGAPGVVVCPTPRLYDVVNGAFVLNTTLAVAGAPTRVAAADLDGQPGDEVVFGSGQVSGPLIQTRTVNGFVDVTPSLPSAPTSTAQTFEQILLTDVDGDGDPDIVHEHRWLRNDATGWTVGAQFGQLVPASARTIVALDVDRDGDQDLFVGGVAGTSRLLIQSAGTFVDGTASWLPTTPLALVERAFAGDIDLDGATDLLFVSGGRSHVLWNGGSTLSLFADVGPAGALADLNHDDRLDLFLGDRVLWNRHTLLWAAGPAVPGTWSVTLETRRSGQPVWLAALMLSDAEIMVTLPGIGTVFVDPTNVAVINMPMAAGACTLGLSIPNSPAVIGVPLRGQAIALDAVGMQLSNVVRDQVR